jgi:hypothetical protein
MQQNSQTHVSRGSQADISNTFRDVRYVPGSDIALRTGRSDYDIVLR